jgi:hypothetical protein
MIMRSLPGPFSLTVLLVALGIVLLIVAADRGLLVPIGRTLVGLLFGNYTLSFSFAFAL